jgi:hypothetical protein
MPSFEHEPLILFPKPKIINEQKDKGDTNGVGLSCTKVVEWLGDFKRGKDNLKKRRLLNKFEINIICFVGG